MKNGFTLIELIIALFIASMVTITLYQLTSQTQKAVKNIISIVDVDVPLLAFYSQLERDVTGMFTPLSTQKANKPGAEPPKSPGPQEKPPEQKSPEMADEKPTEKKEEKKVEQVFFLEEKEGQIICSFITTAAIQKFDKNGPINTEPFIRRVAYIFEKDPTKPGLMRLLYRYNTDNLSVDAILKSDFKPNYELANHIKSLSIEVGVFEPVEKAEGQEQKSSSAKLTSWKESEIKDKYKTFIPAFVNVKGIFTNKAGNEEYNFEFMFKVYAYQEFKPKPLPNRPNLPGNPPVNPPTLPPGPGNLPPGSTGGNSGPLKNGKQ